MSASRFLATVVSLLPFAYLAVAVALNVAAELECVFLGRRMPGAAPLYVEFGRTAWQILRADGLLMGAVLALYCDWLRPLAVAMPPVVAAAGGVAGVGALVIGRLRGRVNGHALFDGLLVSVGIGAYLAIRPYGPSWTGPAVAQACGLALLASVPFAWRWYQPTRRRRRGRRRRTQGERGVTQRPKG